MELNNKKLERNSRIIYYAISIILCLFLILLSNKIIDDLDRATVRPEVSNFEDKLVQENLSANLKSIDADIENLSAKNSNIEKTISTARENYDNEKQSFDNWVQTRKTLGSPDKDIEVSSRAKKLDDYYKVEQDWRNQRDNFQKQIDIKNNERANIQDKFNENFRAAELQFNVSLKKYELKVFLIRLLFVAPILFLGIFFFIRYRNHKYWPLFFAFTLFSFYCFFFGLLPYLPSYGGYVRNTVGILLSAGLGYYAIKYIQRYMALKKAELEISTEERARKIGIEVAEKALDNHFCPSCGKDFVLKKWDFPSKTVENELYKYVTDFCRHCGLELFSKCESCGEKNFKHLAYCSSCGCSMTKNKAQT
ncbi:MAG: hypothetical protein ABIO44_03200 [Saprospiraceae bacterium]